MSAHDIIDRELGHPEAIINGANKVGLGLAWACALVEQESAGKNIFGHDAGGLFPGEPVTKEKVQKLIAHVKAGGVSNGVGLTQLTYIGFIYEAEHLGGAHLPKNQCLVGFRLLKSLINQYGESGAWHYNGSPAYQSQIAAKYAAWKKRLN